MTRSKLLAIIFLVSIILTFFIAGCATVNNQWKKAKSEDTLGSYEFFLTKYPDSEYTSEARTRIEDLEWISALDLNSIEAYTNYLNNNPQGKYISQAENNIEELEWKYALDLSSIESFREYLKKYPQGSYMFQAKVKLEALSFEQAKTKDSIDAYELFLNDYPDGVAAIDAQKRLRQLRYDKAMNERTIEAFKFFLSWYSDGLDVDTIKKELHSLQVLEKSMDLGREIMKHAPQSYISMSMFGNMNGGGLTTKRSNPTVEDLSKLRVMLSEGANPNLVRVAGFEPAGEKKTGGFVLLSTGKPGQIVRAEEGGITLLEYCRLNGLGTIASLIVEYGAK
ncbi:hypothetical protein JW979_05960 [bacterium]|nr:hypothetical protein [candidate division CSSED10-310 bacterium]